MLYPLIYRSLTGNPHFPGLAVEQTKLRSRIDKDLQQILQYALGREADNFILFTSCLGLYLTFA